MRAFLFALVLSTATLLAFTASAQGETTGLVHAVPVDSATARVLLAQAARQYPKFGQALADVRQHDPLLRRFVVVTASGPLGSPTAAFGNGAVRLDRRFLEQPQPGFDDNRLVVVLYHEIGHLHYFAQVPPGQRNSSASEQAAFEYSLSKTRQLAEAGDCRPLQTGLYYMQQRSRSNNLADPHVVALQRLVASPLFADYQRYVAARCPMGQ